MARLSEQTCLENLKANICGYSFSPTFHKLTPAYICRDCNVISNAILNASPNPEESLFPDFLFDGGFIEHFTVSASKKTRKGEKFRQEEEETNKIWDESFQEEKLQFEQSDFSPNTMNLSVNGKDFSGFTYEDYSGSFRKNWEKHIKSLSQYEGDKTTGIFLVDYQGGLLIEMQNDEFIGFYKLSRDRQLLQYLYDYKDLLKYVIFIASQYCEFISLEEIPDLLNNLPEKIVFEEGNMKKRHILTSLDF